MDASKTAFAAAADDYLAYVASKKAHTTYLHYRETLRLFWRFGAPGLDFRCLRRTFATHFRKHGDAKDLQSAMRHADVTMSSKCTPKKYPKGRSKRSSHSSVKS